MVRVELVLVRDASKVDGHSGSPEEHSGNAEERTVLGRERFLHPSTVAGENRIDVASAFQFLVPTRTHQGLILRKCEFEEGELAILQGA